MNLPSALVVAKNGWLKTPMNACIHGWTSHLIVKGTSSTLSNFVDVSFMVGGMGLLNCELIFVGVWMLCSTPSEFRMLYVCASIMP